MAARPVTIQREKDGRHAVMDADGNLLGRHKTVFGAARQIHDYYPEGGEEGSEPGMSANHGEAEAEAGVTSESEPVGSRDVRPHVPRPRIPRPPKSEHPKPDTKRIPRP